MAEAIGALSSFTDLFGLAVETVKAIDHIRKRKSEFDKLRKQLVAISQYLLKLQNTSADLAWHERIVVKPHIDLTLRLLAEDVSKIKSLASRISRRATESQFLEHVTGRLTWYGKEFREWAKSSQIVTRTSHQRLPIISDAGRSGTVLAGFVEDTSSRVLQWISPMDQRERHLELQSQQIANTAMWFLDSVDYMSWRDSKTNNMLWVRGGAGSGKTFLASHAINDLSKRTTDNNSRLSYAYCDFRVRSTFTDVCASLVRQVLSADRDMTVPSIARELFNDHNESKPPSLSDLARIYLEAVSVSGIVYVVLDALDEISPCSELEMATLSNILQRSNTKILVFSRNSPPHLGNEAAPFPVHVKVCPISPDRDDLKLVLVKRLKGQIKDAEVERLIGNLAAKKNGSFVSSIYLLDEILHNKCTLKQIRESLRTQLDDATSHANALSSIVDRVYSQEDTYLGQLASHTLMWLCHAKRPMTAEEICEAFAIRNSETHLSIEQIPNAAFVTKSCMGLIKMDSLSNMTVTHSAIIVELQRREEQYKQGLLQVSRNCLTYLTLQDVASHGLSEEDWNAHPFLSYAGENWVYHLQDIKTANGVDDQSALLKTLEVIQRSALTQSTSADPSSPAPIYKQVMTTPKQALTGLSQLQICVRFNLFDAAKVLIKEGSSADHSVRNSWETTPFHEAARSGNESFLSLLDETHDPLKKDIDGRLATHYASYYGNGRFLLRFCLRFPDTIDKPDSAGETPLMMAAALGYDDIVRTLLSLNARTDFTNTKSDTALHLATINGHHNIAMLLLASGADAKVKNASGNTLLHCAVLGRSAQLVRSLLLKGIDVNAKDKDGRSALHVAADKAESLVISRLLARGADVNLKANQDITPLMEAISSGHERIVRELVDRGADLEQASTLQRVDYQGLIDPAFVHRTALNIAAELGHTKIVQILLEAGATANGGYEVEALPLCFASFKNHLDIARLLVEHSADINAVTSNNSTPLHFAASAGHVGLVQFLVESGAEVNAVAGSKKTALSFAVESGHSGVVQLLLGYGARAPVNTRSVAEQTSSRALREIVQASEPSTWTDRDISFDLSSLEYDRDLHVAYTGAAFDGLDQLDPSPYMEVDSIHPPPKFPEYRQSLRSKHSYLSS